MRAPKLFGKIHWWIKEKSELFYKKSILFSTESKVKYYEKRYFKKFKIKLNIHNPTTFYDKINYLKFYRFSREIVDYTDKIKAKDIVFSANPNCKFAKIIKIFDSYSDFKKNFLISINQFHTNCVVKTNNNSGCVFMILFNPDGSFFIKNKQGYVCSLKNMTMQIKKAFNLNYYFKEFEKNYKYIKPRIFIEEYLLPNGGDTYDFEFFCNYGNIRMINVNVNGQTNQSSCQVLTDPSLKPLNVSQPNIRTTNKNISKPKYFDEMASFASNISKKFPILRVDFLCNNDNFYFCEFTFYKSGGFNCFYPIEANFTIGALFDI